MTESNNLIKSIELKSYNGKTKKVSIGKYIGCGEEGVVFNYKKNKIIKLIYNYPFGGKRKFWKVMPKLLPSNDLYANVYDFGMASNICYVNKGTNFYCECGFSPVNYCNYYICEKLNNISFKEWTHYHTTDEIGVLKNKLKIFCDKNLTKKTFYRIVADVVLDNILEKNGKLKLADLNAFFWTK